ncbi:MAG: oligoendopeptidase F [Lachnospiraceae bacterium]|nr:oligoendopeptidase F [Lachnospiraceae bacterium]
MTNGKSIIKRGEQNPANCWSVEDIFPNDEAWEAEFQSCQTIPEQVAAFRGRLGSDAATLLEYLELSEQVNVRMESLFYYAMLRHDEDTANPVYQAVRGRCLSFLVRIESANAFAEPELVAIPEEELEQFYAKEPGLEKYRRHLTKARLERDHILSQAEEDLLAAAGEVTNGPSSIYNSFADADMKFPAVTDSTGAEHPLTHGSYIALMESPDRTLRENAFKSLYGVYDSFRNGLASMLNTEIRKNVFFAQARKYDSALMAALSPVEIPESVYHNLIDAVHQNLDKMYRYMSLRKKAMGLDELHMYDLYAAMLPDADRVIPFEQAKEYVLAATEVLGSEYHKVIESSFENRWMDIYENENKRSGAYSCGCPVHPFVLLNHKDTLDSAFTLAHELGHAMHSYLSTQNQPPVYADYVIFVAEVASTCNEALLMRYLLDHTTDKRERAVLINYFLEQFRTTLYRQTMFAEFELKTHRLAEAGEALTAQQFCDIYYDLNKLYYGDNVIVDPEIAMEWARIPHFYRRFYVYQYATGFSAAMALSQRILSGGPEAVEHYLQFLSGGCSADPISLLKIAGVDMSTPTPVNEALALFGNLIEELEELLA